MLNLPVHAGAGEFFQSILRDLENAAMIDGCTDSARCGGWCFRYQRPGYYGGHSRLCQRGDEFRWRCLLNSTAAMRIAGGITPHQGEFTFPWPIISAALIVAIVPVANCHRHLQERGRRPDCWRTEGP